MATKKLCVLLIVLLSMVEAKSFAYDIAVDNADGVTIYYSYINEGTELEVVQGNYSGSVVIPEEVSYESTTRKVTSIGEEAFKYCYELTSVVIPNSVKSIGTAAFGGSSGLTSVTIGDGVTSIGGSAFSGCIRLKNVSIGKSVISIGDRAFNGCSNLTSITIPNSVTSIGKSAFEGSHLYYIEIPDNVTTIEEKTFYNISLLTSVSIGNGVTTIGDYAFAGCRLTSITFPNSLTTISNGAFSGCYRIDAITIPNSVTTIGESAFSYCSGLKSITIGSSVISIGASAFEECDLSEVISEIENPFIINSNTFSYNTYNNSTLSIPAETTNRYKTTEGWNKFVNISERQSSNITHIDNNILKAQKIYSINGIKNSIPNNGINIIQMKNGMTKKVIVK